MIDALADGSVEDHREELGDLLLQVVFQAELRHQEGRFGIDDVALRDRRPSWCAATPTCSAR